MIKLFASVCIEAPADVVWARLAKLEDIQLWSEAVVHARCTGAVSQGVGAERVCTLAANTTITERWVAWDEGRSFTYEGSGIPLIQRAVNRWSVIPQGKRARRSCPTRRRLVAISYAWECKPFHIEMARRNVAHRESRPAQSAVNPP